jgi:hypothetical protein
MIMICTPRLPTQPSPIGCDDNKKEAKKVNRSFLRRTKQTLLALTGVLALSLTAHSADLGISDGVVVKFGNGAGIAVLDGIHLSNQATFTSTKDDSLLGQTGPTAGIPAKGNWNGIKLEASAPPTLVKLEDIRLRYGGGAGSAALDIRKTAPLVKSVVVRDSIIGVRVMDGASPSFQGLSLIGNDIGMEVGGNATPVLTGSEITSNTQGMSNLTPATVIQATGNWWGDATGPKDAVGNPAGKGDSVSSGVNYSNWSTVIPLIDPKIRVVGSPSYTSSANVTLNLACRNAIEYRVAENGNFTGLAFLPMVASTPFVLSSGDGIKQISVQYRAATGNLITADLSGGILYDANGPTLTITNPANGSYITKAISVDATATDPAGVSKVEFYIDNVLAIADTVAPYNYAWDATLVADGTHTIKVIAYDTVGHSTTDSRSVSKGVAPLDTTGPALSNITFSGTALANGATLTKSSTIAASASDPSGVAHIDFLLDGVVFGTNSSGNYTATLDINSVTDGAHVLSVKGYDSLNNQSQTSFNIVVAMAVPAAPTLSKPTNGLVTNQKQQTATGTAEKQTQIQIYSNNAALGSPLAVDSNGNFSIPITLNDGANQIQAAAINRAGNSPFSNSVNVTVDASIPGTPSGLTALAQVAGKIKLSWLAVNDTAVKGYDVYRSQVAFTGINEASKANTSPITTPTFDDLPPADGAYY